MDLTPNSSLLLLLLQSVAARVPERPAPSCFSAPPGRPPQPHPAPLPHGPPPRTWQGTTMVNAAVPAAAGPGPPGGAEAGPSPPLACIPRGGAGAGSPLSDCAYEGLLSPGPCTCSSTVRQLASSSRSWGA